MKRDKNDKLAQLAQLLQIYQGFTGGENQQALQQENLLGLQQQRHQNEAINPLHQQLLAAQVQGAGQENQANQAMNPAKLEMLFAQIAAATQANQQSAALAPYGLEHAKAQAQSASAVAPFAGETARLGNQKTQAEIAASGANDQYIKTHTKGLQQEQQFNAENQVPFRMAHIAQESPALSMHPDLQRQLFEAGGFNLAPQASQATPDASGLNPLQQAHMQEQMFNQGHLPPDKLGQYHEAILGGMAADPSYQWPQEFQAMQYYNQNPRDFTTSRAAPEVAPQQSNSTWDMAQSVLHPHPQAAAPMLDPGGGANWGLYPNLHDQIMKEFLLKQKLQQINGGRPDLSKLNY